MKASDRRIDLSHTGAHMADDRSGLAAAQGLRFVPKALARASCVGLTLAMAGLLLHLLAGTLAADDESRRVPKLDYFAGLALVADGDYREAERQLRVALRTAIKTSQSRWIDSICVLTAQGEVARQTGRYEEALALYEEALKLAARFPTWPLELNEPVSVRPTLAGQVKVPPWGRSQRGAVQASWPSTYMIQQGQILDEQQLADGGIYKPPVLFPVLASEILSATTLALRRRRELLGPSATYDPLSAELVATWTRSGPPEGHWTRPWFDVLLGLAYASGGKDHLAAPLLARGAQTRGGWEHPLSGPALAELARMALDQAQPAKAIELALEASYSGFLTGDLQLIEDSLRLAHEAHVIDNRPGTLPALEAALRWARQQRYRKLEASLALCLAESAPQAPAAAAHLTRAGVLLQRSDMDRSFLRPRWEFLSGRLAYASGQVVAGDRHVATAVSSADRFSLRLWHARIVDTLFQAGWFTPRDAMDLYGFTLRESNSADWRRDPLESLWMQTSVLAAPMERWFLLAMSREKPIEALEIADLARRRRFYNTQPLGGRLLGLRWLLDGPEAALGAPARLQRQELLNGAGAFQDLAQRSRGLVEQLRELPLDSDDGPERQARRDRIQALAEVAARQEALLRNVAVARQGAPLSFPPQRTVAEVQRWLADDQAVLVYFATAPQVFGFLVTHDDVAVWEAGPPADVLVRTRKLLAALGQTGDGHRLKLPQFQSFAWRQAADDLFGLLTVGLTESDWFLKYREIVVVPDWVVWYAPFELIDHRQHATSESPTVQPARGVPEMIGSVRLRYVPTLGLAVTDQPRPRTTGPTVVAAGRVADRDDPALAVRTVERLQRRLPGSVALPPLDETASAMSVASFDRLVVLHGIDPTVGFPHGWPLLTLDRKRVSASPLDLMALPWSGPAEIVLPGFRTAAEHNLQNIPLEAAGSELFQASCGLLASGARTVLLSRWRMGGQTAHDLVTEFVQELPHQAASDAWQRSVLLASDGPLYPEREPRLDFPPDLPDLRANHPFLWSGYLLIDTGSEAPTDSDAAPLGLSVR